MTYNTHWHHYLSVALLGGVLFGAGAADATSPSSDSDLTTRGPAGTVRVTPEPGTAAPVPATLPAPASPRPLSFKVNYVYRPGGRGPLKSLVEGSVLNSGDHYKIQFTPAEDGYVYIFQVDSSKAIFQLFPMTSFGGVRVDNLNPVKGGVTYHLPAKDKSFKLDDTVGSETIVFLAFREPNRTLEQQYKEIINARLARDGAKASSLQTAMNSNFRTRGLAGIVDDPQKKTTTVPWTETESFTMPVQNLNELCEDCVSMVTFEHR